MKTPLARRESVNNFVWFYCFWGLDSGSPVLGPGDFVRSAVHDLAALKGRLVDRQARSIYGGQETDRRRRLKRPLNT